MSDEIRVRLICPKPRSRRKSKNVIMWFRDPDIGRLVRKSAGTTDTKAARDKAIEWQYQVRNGLWTPPAECTDGEADDGLGPITWQQFRTQYEQEHLRTLSERTCDAADTALNHLERVLRLDGKRLAVVTSKALSTFQAKLRQATPKSPKGVKDVTIDGYLAYIGAALKWAVRVDLLDEAPEIPRLKRAKGIDKLMRGRPIMLEEFERMLKAARKVRPRDYKAWRRYLRGLWLSGLRLEESLLLSWDLETPFSIDLSGKRPLLRILAEGEKGHQDRLLAITPDFAEFLLKVPDNRRVGRVFKLRGLETGKPISGKRVGRIVSAIGKRAKVLVNKAAGKCASAHDLRRSFGTRWAKRVMPAVLQKLMRHSAIETTMKYYVDLDANELAEELWTTYAPEGCANSAPKAHRTSDRT